jgi:hypothetical protein
MVLNNSWGNVPEKQGIQWRNATEKSQLRKIGSRLGISICSIEAATSNQQ